MKIPFSYSIILRKDHLNKDGKCAVYLRVIINRKIKYYHLNVFSYPEKFDEKKQLIKGNDSSIYKMNAIIEAARKKASDYLNECIEEEKNPSIEEFTTYYEGKRLKDKHDFFDFMKHYIELNFHSLSKESLRTYKSQITKLKKFRSRLSFKDIDEKFIKDYEQYMKKVLGNQPNTYYKSMSFIKSVCNLAIREGIIDKNPFMVCGYKIKKIPGTRQYLDDQEVNQLLLLYESKKLQGNDHLCLEYFLFSCFTGLRFSDIRQLKIMHIKDNCIELNQHKTSFKVVIPLSNLALSIIQDRLTIDFKETYIFKAFTNQGTNRILKRIAEIAGIKKPLTFHVARHTFATLALSIGIPLPVVKELLGHRDMKTTQIYAKILDKKKKGVYQQI